MCRWIAYSGQPIYIEQLMTVPEHSLVEQSFNTEMNFNSDGNLMSMNGDGFGIGWYSERTEPGLFKDERPAWSNRNLHEICKQVRARIFFAHVRATTTGAVMQANCHPFRYKNWIFQHNGDVTDFPKIRRDLQMSIAPELYSELKGTTDSETFFYLAVTYGLMENPKEALRKMVDRVIEVMEDHKLDDSHLNLSLAISDGQKIYTLRFAHNVKSKTQFFSSESGWVHERARGVNTQNYFPEENIIVVSEPLDYYDKKWTEIPDNSFATVFESDVKIERFMD